MRHILLVVVCLGTILTATVGASAASHDAHHKPGGLVPHLPHGEGLTSREVQGSGDLTYHGGAVMRTITTYTIYWLPTSSTLSYNGHNAAYESTINQYFTDVAADSGLNTNVYATDPQYYDTLGGGIHHIAYASTFGGSIVDTRAFPASACNDGFDATCLTESQLETEIQHVVEAQGWPENGTSQYFLFTPQNNGSCFDDLSACAYFGNGGFCAYHDWFPTSRGEIIFADQPWTANWPSSNNRACDFGQYPNSSDADPTINVVSHENNEAITDPNLNAWYDAAQYENGDKCAWTFGALSGSNGFFYNQTINGHHYFMQEEYNNARHNCVQGLPAVPANTAAPLVTGTPTLGAVLTAQAGSWSNSPTTYSYQWERCDSGGANCSSVGSAISTSATTTTHAVISTDVGHTLRVQVTASNDGGAGSPALSPATAIVDSGAPAYSSGALITGTATVGQVLTGAAGSWSHSPTKFTYAWLRCDATGNGCVTLTTVAKTTATSVTHTLVPGDDKHTLRLSVTAFNTIGASAAQVTSATAVVNGEPVYSNGLSLTGTATVGQTLTAHAGSWAPAATKYIYAWLRCDSSGNSCTTITTGSATTSATGSYKLVAADDLADERRQRRAGQHDAADDRRHGDCRPEANRGGGFVESRCNEVRLRVAAL